MEVVMEAVMEPVMYCDEAVMETVMEAVMAADPPGPQPQQQSLVGAWLCLTQQEVLPQIPDQPAH